jgi:hypothetical protein
MADDWVRLGMAIVVIAFVSVCLYSTSSRIRPAQTSGPAVLSWR